MTKQIIESPKGERLVVLPEAEYQALVEAAEDALEVAAVDRFRQRLAAGEEELVPAEIVDRLLDGENKVAVWRIHRGLTAKELAQKAGITPAYLSQIETGKRDGSVGTMRKIAEVLKLAVDDLI